MNPSSSGLLLIFLVAVAGLIGRIVWLRKRARTAQIWPTTDATIQSGEQFISSGRGGVIILSFTFSYVVDAEYYSGRFELIPESGSADGVLSRVKDRKVRIHYDPAKPATYYISEKQMENCDVVQGQS